MHCPSAPIQNLPSGRRACDRSAIGITNDRCMTTAGFGDTLRRLVFQRSFKRRECSHRDTVRQATPERLQCEGCVEEGTRTVHLRMCLTCGEVGCCDSSPARHARNHHEQTGHPLIRSIEPKEHWAWCYPDNTYLSRVPVVPPVKATAGSEAAYGEGEEIPGFLRRLAKLGLPAPWRIFPPQF